MKKTIFTLAATASLVFSSCDMNLEEPGALSDENVPQNYTDCVGLRTNIYTNLRGLMGGSYIYLSAIQGDEFFGTLTNGNNLGPLSMGNISSSDGDVENAFGGCMGQVQTCNFMLNRIDPVIEKYAAGIGEKDATYVMELNRFKGEADFAIAYYYYYLVEKFCNSWNNIDPNTPNSGMPILTVYHPTDDRASYPARNTLRETYAFIEQKLDEAYTALKAYEDNPDADLTGMGGSAIYVNTATVRALQCRVALLTQQWDKCVDYGSYIATVDASGNVTTDYTLVNNPAALKKMWLNDEGTEVIFEPYGTNISGDQAPSYGSVWSSGNEGTAADPDSPWYIPTAYVGKKNSLYGTNDMRYNVFFKEVYTKVSGTKYKVTVFNKFPGNPDLNLGAKNEFRNRSKVFRTSETLLNLAEAYYELGNEPLAKGAYMALRASRNNNYDRFLRPGDEALTGTALRDAIRLERQRELIGEGFRISDLRRWNQGFNRTDTKNTAYADPRIVQYVIHDYNVVYGDDDYRYVWPIPVHEMDNNPQMVQNYGY